MKRRITVTVDDSVLSVAKGAVGDGEAESISAYVNAALHAWVAHAARLRALDELIDGYEAEHGAFSEAELAEQEQGDRDAAAAVRAGRRKAS